jgi:hypothetical protein
MRLRLAFAAFVVVCVVTACQLIAGIGDKVLWDGGTVTNPCMSADLPVIPTNNPPTTPNNTYVAALSQIKLGSSDGGPYYGFNLDNTCTCQFGQSEACIQAPDASPHCDDDGGIDNYARHAFEAINELQPDGGIITEARFNTALKSGLSGAVIQVSNYNGLADDSAVTVTIYGSQGFQGFVADGSAPKFDGTDPWVIDPGSASGQFSVNDAYVTSFTLVAVGLNFPIIVGSAITQPVLIQLDEGIIRADLDMTGDVMNIKSGVLGGRWDPAKFLPSLAPVPDPLFGGYLCGTDVTYQLLKQRICENTDINRSSSGDGKGACNSVSMGLGFVAVPAIKGPVGGFVDAGQPCGASWTDSCN